MSYATWMSDPAVQAKTVGDIVLPGTHDSGTFSLTEELSQVEYDNIAFLWALNPGQAPAGFPDGAKNYVGPYAYQFIMDLVLSVSTSQSDNLGAQLGNGIRFFDLRLYWDTDQLDVYVQHGLRGTTFLDLMNQVAAYLTANPAGRELILIEISHTNFGSNASGAQRVVDVIADTVGASVYQPTSVAELAGQTLGSITGQGSRIVFLNPQSDNYPNDSIFLSGASFGDSGRGSDGTASVSQLAELEAAGLAAPRTLPLYQIAWTLTPDLPTIQGAAISRLQGNPPTQVLHELADTAAGQLSDFLEAHNEYSFNLITTDWYQDSPVVSIAAQLSGYTG